MSYSILPVLNLDGLARTGDLSVVDINAYETQETEYLNLLSSRLAECKVLPPAKSFPERVPQDQILLWFVGMYSDEDIAELASHLDGTVKARTILFNYAGDEPRELLESIRCAGLITEETSLYWRAELPKTAFRRGVGHGLYGLRSVFDEHDFDPAFRTVRSSEHYMIFDNHIDYQLDRILYKYILTLLK